MPTNGGDALAVLRYADFFQELRDEGFVVGVGHYLRAQRLLDTVGDVDPGVAETLLCPIFATSGEEQLRFHTLYQRVFPDGHEEPPALSTTGGRRRPSLTKFPLTGEHAGVGRLSRSEKVILAVLAVAVVAVIGGYAINRWHPFRHEQGPTPADTAQAAVKPSPDTGTGPTPIDTAAAELAVIPPPAVSLETPKQEPIRQPTAPWWPPLLPFLALGGLEWWRRRGERAVAERQSGVTPPYTWPVRVENASAALFVTPAFLQASRTVRRRQLGADLRFAVRPSIEATIEARGFPTFRYERITRPPEYLILIERAGPADHQARHFDALAQALAVEGAFVTRCFYEHDPRVCFTEEAMSGIRLGELHRRLPSDRVLVLGSGSGFLDPIYGRPLPWLSLLQDWDEIALLTPVPPAGWGAREVALAGEMLVLPATLEGLRATIDHFDAGSEPDLRAWHERDRDSVRVEDHDDVTPAELRRALGDDLFRWVAACAVYPELLWDLTLFLGSQEEVGRGLITERNVLTIARLSWFRRGAFPESLRLGLLGELEAMDRPLDRDTEGSVRELLERILEGEALDPASMAGRAHRRELLHQRLYLYRDDPTRFYETLKELQQEATAAELVQDVTVMRLLRSAPASPLALKLPKAVRDRFFPGGMPELGVTRLASTGLTCVAAAAIWFVTKPAPAPPPPPPPPTVGRLVPTAIALSVPPGFRFQLGVSDTAGQSVYQEVIWSSTADSVVSQLSTRNMTAALADFSSPAVGQATIRATVGSTAVDIAVEVRSTRRPHAGVLGPPRVLPPLHRGRITWPTFDRASRPSNALQAEDRGPDYLESCDTSVVRVDARTKLLFGARAGSALVINHTSTFDYAALVRVPGTTSQYHSPGFPNRPLDATSILAVVPLHDLAVLLRADSITSVDVTAIVANLSAADSAALARVVTSALSDSVPGAASRVRFTARRDKGACDRSAFGWAVAAGMLDRVDVESVIGEPSLVLPSDEGWVFLGDYDAKKWKTRYFSFPTSATPAEVVGRKLRMLGTATSMNVRDTPESFPSPAPGRAVLRTGDSVQVLAVRPWGTTTYQWAQVRFWRAAQTAPAKRKPTQTAVTPSPRQTPPVTRPTSKADGVQPDVTQQAPGDVSQQAPGDVSQQAPGDVSQQAPGDVSQQAPGDVSQQAPKSAGLAPKSAGQPSVPDTSQEPRKTPTGPQGGAAASDSAFVTRVLDAFLGKYSSDDYQAAMKRLLGGNSRADLIGTLASRNYPGRGDQLFLRNLWRLVKCEEPSERELSNLSVIDKQAYNGNDLVARVLQDSTVRSTWSQCVGGQPYRPPAMAK